MKLFFALVLMAVLLCHTVVYGNDGFDQDSASDVYSDPYGDGYGGSPGGDMASMMGGGGGYDDPYGYGSGGGPGAEADITTAKELTSAEDIETFIQVKSLS